MPNWVHQLIDGHEAAKPAVEEPWGDVLSYGDLRARAEAVEADLRREGARPGDRVMLICENCGDYVAMALACSRLRAWFMPVNARHTEAELTALRDHSQARIVARTHGAEGLSYAPAAGDPEPVSEDPHQQVAALLYTTGTTSAPKGVMLTHRNLTWNAANSARLRGMRPDDLVLGVLPGSHAFGFSSTMLATLHRRACIRFLPRFEPQAVLDALAEGASVWPAVPQMYAALLKYMEDRGAKLRAPHLHYISAGGAPLDPDWKARVEAAFGLALNNGYGITEAGPTVAATRVDAPRSDLSSGPAVWDVTLSIDGPDKDGVGEVLIDSPGVMKGYFRNPEATAEALPRPGLLRSGDLGRLDPDGALFIEGRKKELIIRSGFNVYPPEIEGWLTKHPAVSVAAVVPHRRDGNEDILAFAMGDVGAEELANWLRQHLVGYKQPQAIFMVDSLPAAPTGKILKHKLISHFADEVRAWEEAQV
ncbi:Long-chain-fatty-acid--CoA ligase [Candidatus Rhodobacter oscarellae]|uniref:Long-chain-fatty-acid--CoA ligase n=1 Tax=Candidatus Rhodobacter oscarellae TaxID=1675527 RepID=A0A0J9H1Z0_9RHOB|nr:AMP-binding protein [Candidatus Rhodobacter lobularis]KMW59733.1 Long-chain-fatty-acid--CoA ligase [Candidatus Rhodobacter lobularis]